ncbi:MAG: hypothetical protein K6U03_09845 [Firmicutes bacterium]|nr:hypothetical protein [Bacillota bacterium]
MMLFHWARVVHATTACLYSASAPKERFHQTEEVFARILAGFEMKGTAEGRQTPSVELVP